MRFQVDLDTCQNHGQCCLNAPPVFSFDGDTHELAFRRGRPDYCASGTSWLSMDSSR